MPQTLSSEWKNALGEDWERIHEEWLHKLANLTLTAYNSDYSNRPFEKKRDMEQGFSDSGFRMNQWIARQSTWGERQMKEREGLLEEQFLKLWPYPTSTYEPRKSLPESAALDSDVEFTGRRIAAFSFMDVRYAVSQWNAMLVKVLQLVYELEPAKIYSLVGRSGYPASAFRKDEDHEYSKITDGVYARTSSSTVAKIELLRNVFDLCDIEQTELVFEMPVETVN